jgi:hypothetical protein
VSHSFFCFSVADFNLIRSNLLPATFRGVRRGRLSTAEGATTKSKRPCASGQGRRSQPAAHNACCRPRRARHAWGEKVDRVTRTPLSSFPSLCEPLHDHSIAAAGIKNGGDHLPFSSIASNHVIKKCSVSFAIGTYSSTARRQLLPRESLFAALPKFSPNKYRGNLFSLLFHACRSVPRAGRGRGNNAKHTGYPNLIPIP